MTLGFTASVWARIGLAVIVAAAGWAAVEGIEAASWPGPPPATPAPVRSAELVLTSSRPVTTWVVTVDGRPATVRLQAPRRFEATFMVPGEARGVVLITASPGADDDEVWAMRLELRGAGATVDRTVWGSGSIIDAIPLGR